ncbi:Alpha/Beta hydrolase protein [Aspergillus pseudodeflectus]|uniref:Alpha/Beta hydrolase protein n=1 Tax=Aspergillus pseudodeflectus TaxID=176178 RepID=A0ABR4KDP2_9EURO
MATLHHSLSSLGPIHPPKIDKARRHQVKAHHVKIQVHDPLDHEAPAILHEPRNYNASAVNNAAVVLISGAGGGVSGPSGIYPSLADKLALLLGIPVVRLDYRVPARTQYCVPDVVAAMDYLEEKFESNNFVIVGWSFGGSPCFTVAALEPERVVGVATVASQTAQTSGISKLSPRPLLLLHGGGDTCLSPSCSESLYRQYGTKGHREIKIFEGDNHGLSLNAPEAEGLLFVFAARTLGFDKQLTMASMGIASQDWVGSEGERVAEMEQGHDLEGGESLNY